MKMLFITSNRLGDAVLNTGLLDHLLRAHEGLAVTVAAGPASMPLYREVPGLERLITIEKKPLRAHWLLLWARTAARRWDIVVDLRASGLSYCLLAGRRLVARRADPSVHRVEELGALLGLAEPPQPTVWLSPSDEEFARGLLPSDRPVIALAPAANWPGKQWPIERFIELARRLTGPGGLIPGAAVLVTAADHERAQVAPLLDALGPGSAIDLVGRADLLEIAACFRRAALFIGNDSGLMHLAAAAGAPTLGLFGPSPEQRFRPWGGSYVRTEESYQELMERKRRLGLRDDCLMESLAVEDVAVAAERLYGGPTIPETQ